MKYNESMTRKINSALYVAANKLYFILSVLNEFKIGNSVNDKEKLIYSLNKLTKETFDELNESLGKRMVSLKDVLNPYHYNVFIYNAFMILKTTNFKTLKHEDIMDNMISLSSMIEKTSSYMSMLPNGLEIMNSLGRKNLEYQSEYEQKENKVATDELKDKESYRAVSKLTYRLVYKLVYILSVLLPESMQDTFISVTRVQPDINALARMRYAIKKLIKESSDEYENALSEIVLPASGVLKDFGIYDAYVAIMSMDLDVLHVPKLGNFENDIRGVTRKPTYKLFVNDNGQGINTYLDNKYLLYKKEFTDLKLYNKVENKENNEMKVDVKEPLDYSKPIRGKHTKTPYRPVGESGLLSNGGRVFELPPDKDNPGVSKIVVIPENELDTLENYVGTIPDSYTLYLREREDGSRYITSDGRSTDKERGYNINTDKIISTVWVDYTENNIWKVQGVNKNNR